MTRKTKATRYSDRFEGDAGNGRLDAAYDLSGNGYLGISQTDGERVLLTPDQVKRLLAFLRESR